MTDMFLAMHGLAIRKLGNAGAVAALLGVTEGAVAEHLAEAVAAGSAIAARGAFMLTPKGQVALKQDYAERFADLRRDTHFAAGYDCFEVVNTELKQLMTDWQMVDVAGESVRNDHADRAYDDRIVERLNALHERADEVLAGLAASLPRLGKYRERLEAALGRIDDGTIEFVSGARIDSYHTVWFELHEDLLRILERERRE